MNKEMLKNMVKLDEHVILIDQIASIDYSKLETDYEITLVSKQGIHMKATNLNAIECAMKLYPSLLEGKRLKWAKKVWYLHNLIGHPLMQLLAMFKKYDWAFYIHEATVPKPEGFKKPKNKEKD